MATYKHKESDDAYRARIKAEGIKYVRIAFEPELIAEIDKLDGPRAHTVKQIVIDTLEKLKMEEQAA